jgi:predicted phage tail protein
MRSKQIASILDAISEGEIGGLVDGARSVYLNDTPVENEDGSKNFEGVYIDQRVGTNTQTAMEGVSNVEREVSVSVKVEQATPVVRTISNVNIDIARITLSSPVLVYTNDKGTQFAAEVDVSVDIQNNGGGFQPAKLVRSAVANTVAVSNNLASMTVPSSVVEIQVRWTGNLVTTGNQFTGLRVDTTQQNGTFVIQRKLSSSPTYVTVETYTFTGASTNATSVSMLGAGKPIAAAYEVKTFRYDVPEGLYDFRVLFVSGVGGAVIEKGTIYNFVNTHKIRGKSLSKYQVSYEVPLPSPGPWDIKVNRVTADNFDSQRNNDLYWDSYTEIISARLRYPNTALVHMKLDAKTFSTVPTRGFRIRGKILSIPNNYNPVTRTYTGLWNGGFTTGFSNNPAWVFYDLISNTRYGLGEYVNSVNIDKWTLYSIAQYCDELVADGYGGFEPRFTCNIYIQGRDEAYTVLNNLASVFRGMIYWINGYVTCVQDAPASETKLFHASNVENGEFNYSSSSSRTVHTVALVAWNDPTDLYRQKVEYVSDQDGILKYGIQTAEISGFGCTSRGQAHRLGKATLYTELYENEVITFKCGLDHISLVEPGSIIKVQDRDRAGADFGGRLLSVTSNSVVLDRPIVIQSGISYSISLELPDGTIVTRAISNGAGTHTNISFVIALPILPTAYSLWVVSSSSLIPESWRVISVTEESPISFSVSALSYRPDKYDYIEKDLILPDIPTSMLSIVPEKPAGLTLTEGLRLSSSSSTAVFGTFSWLPSNSASGYVATYVYEGRSVSVETTETSIDIFPLNEGVYTLSVYSVNAFGKRSTTNTISSVVYGKLAPPADVTNFSLTVNNNAAYLTWDRATDLDVEIGGYMVIKHTANTTLPNWSNASLLGVQVPGKATSTILPLLTGTYMAKWVDSTGNESVNPTIITTNVPDIINMNAVLSYQAHPTWVGTLTNCSYDAEINGIKLNGLTTIDSILSNIDSIDTSIDSLGGIVNEAYFTMSGFLDLGSVFSSRVTTSLEFSAFNEFDTIDSRFTNIDTWKSIDGDNISETGAVVQISTTLDNPGVNPTWSAWRDVYVGDWKARAFRFRIRMFNTNPQNNLIITSFSALIDMPDKIASANNIVSNAGAAMAITYNYQFRQVVGLAITAENMQTGDYYTLTNKTSTGFSIRFFNSSNVGISRQFDWIVRGY